MELSVWIFVETKTIHRVFIWISKIKFEETNLFTSFSLTLPPYAMHIADWMFNNLQIIIIIISYY